MKNGTGRLMELLRRAVERPERTVLGLSSGTSRDGIDAALVRITGGRDDASVDVLGYRSYPYSPGLERLLDDAEYATASGLAELDLAVGEAFAAAALAHLTGLGRSPDELSCIGSHGQTVYHQPPGPDRSGTTLQIGDLDVISRRTGVLTVGDFRRADVAAGGSGAPLIPLVDWMLFREAGRARLLLNIGGIANVTRVVDDLDEVVAFDTGPGNTLSDEIVRRASGGGAHCDAGGALALEGTPDRDAAEAFLASYGYFQDPPPKSTGKELFGQEAAEILAEMTSGHRDIEDLSDRELRDLLATAALVVGLSVGRSLELLPTEPPAEEMFVSGGGLRNRAIIRAIAEACPGVRVSGLDDIGFDPDAKEAVGFAVLAHETLFGRPGNVPGATGAGRPVVLGKISPGL